MKTIRRPRSDSYEAQLSPEERGQLHGWLLDSGLSKPEVVERVLPWKRGERKGKKPDDATLWRISQRVRTENTLTEMEATALVARAACARIRKSYQGVKDVQEEMLDEVMTLHSQDTLQKLLKKLDPQGRAATTRLMLQRSEQKLQKAKFALVSKLAEQSEQDRKKKEGKNGRKKRGVSKEMFDRVAEELKLL